MTTPFDHQRQESSSGDDRCRRRRAKQITVAASAAIAILALFDAASLGKGGATVASGSVRLVDQATDLPAPDVPAPAPPGPQLVLPPGTVLPPGVAMPPIPPEVPHMLQQGLEMLAAGPPPGVPDEVCRYNTVRVPCPP